MGVILKAICACGYQEDELIQGPGLSQANQYLLCICESCNSLATSTVNDNDEFICGVCNNKMIKYDDHPKCVRKTDAEGLEAVWGQDITIRKKNYCPRCKNQELQFSEIGVWD